MKKGNIYIIPTKLGFIYTGILFTIFLIGLTYTNNFTLITAFIMLTYFITQMLKSHQIIKNIELFNINIKSDFSDNPISINSNISNNNDAELIRCSIYEKKTEYAPKTYQNSEIKINAQIELKRKKFKIDKIKFYSSGYSSLFYVWRYFGIDKTFYVYPKRRSNDINNTYTQNISQNSFNEEEFSHHVSYTPGMSAKRIDWNIFAKSEQLYWKKHIGSNNLDIVIDIDALVGEFEDKLSHAAYIIDYLFKNNIKWSLKYRGKSSESNSGIEHHKYCLELLSEAIDEN
jgi:hypothetical protein